MRRRFVMALLPTLLPAALPATLPAQVTLAGLVQLARDRAERSRPKQLAMLQPFLADLSLAYRENQDFLDRRIAEVAAIGDALVPVLLERLQPASAGDSGRNLAANSRRVLERLDPASFVDALAELVASGNEVARIEAINLLGHAATPQAIDLLTDLIGRTSGEEYRLTLRALRLQKAAGPAAKVVTALGSSDRALRDDVLAYLVAAHPPQVVETVIQALANERDARLLPNYVEYFAAAVREHDSAARALLPLLDPERLDWQDRRRLVQVLATVAPRDHEPTSRRLHDLIDSGETSALTVQAAVTLRSLGDRQGVTKLQRILNEQLRKPQRKRESALYEQRANLAFAIEEYGDAIADFEKVLEFSDGGLAMTRRAYVGMIRAEIRRKKVANATKAMKASGMTAPEIEAIGLEDPVVQEALQQDKIRSFLQSLAKDAPPK
ncbi:MAG: hypothetical protein JNK78_08880 [Planctomycetes bacterium]|nr:hypothetical protein [Planctomycetota bacterium]